MNDLEDTLQSVLSDPAQLQQLQALAKSLGLSPESSKAENPPVPEPILPPIQNSIPKEAEAKASKPQPEALLRAMLPFLKPSRREKLNRALQVAHFSHLAELALKNFGNRKE